jgi:hypothetical protein
MPLCIALSGCYSRSLIPVGAGKIILECKVNSSFSATSAPTIYKLILNESANTAVVEYESGLTKPLESTFAADSVVLTLKEIGATEQAIRERGNYFGGTVYGGGYGSGQIARIDTFQINRETGAIEYESKVMGRHQQEKPRSGTCKRI